MTKEYTLHIAHLYGDLMNTYGDLGNILVLKYYGKKMGINVESQVVSLDEDFKSDDYDIAVFGGGQDFEQSIVSKDFQTKKMKSKSLSIQMVAC
ncbi:Lipid II isoglutaminyl synthase (glutamine-hydrolyzing) subunit GatD [Apilactobacillus kunkeei]|nr:Lipid II isoglutaminyl synthase (glutamine-hydrolyzing) subunit GatD [Apilactobacillus kunkeei]